MLNKIKIKNLFGLYSYDFDFLLCKESPIRFITGPNGYGKSTILGILSHLLQCEFVYFEKLAFEEIQISFDEKLIVISRIPIEASGIGEDLSKKSNTKQGKIRISLLNVSNLVEESSFEIIPGIESIKNNSGRLEIEMFLRGESHYFISDRRLLKTNSWVNGTEIIKPSDNVVNLNAEDLKRRLENCREQINSILSIQNLTVDFSPVSKEVYESRKAVLTSGMKRMLDYGLAKGSFELPTYQPIADGLMGSFLNMAESAVKYATPLLEKVELFKNIIERSDFVDKDIQISPDYGYRFVSRNQDKTLLDGSDLSSGEQHFLIQTYELIFNAQENSLALIDEPEMSFHIIWQMDFLRNICEIANLKGLQCIVATHSPQIFDSMWELTSDLYEMSHPQKEDE